MLPHRVRHSSITTVLDKNIEAIVPTLKEFLRERGLELNPDKTKIVPVEQGFGFLGFYIRQFLSFKRKSDATRVAV